MKKALFLVRSHQSACKGHYNVSEKRKLSLSAMHKHRRKDFVILPFLINKLTDSDTLFNISMGCVNKNIVSSLFELHTNLYRASFDPLSKKRPTHILCAFVNVLRFQSKMGKIDEIFNLHTYSKTSKRHREIIKV